MTDLNQLKQQVIASVDGLRDRLLAVAHDIHARPEIAMQEQYAVERLTGELTKSGFSVNAGITGLPTAFVATAGTGGRTIGLLAEYDALPGLGHACGHNTSAGGVLGAGLALQQVLKANGLPGTIKLFGTPGEERGGGKVIMTNGGAFDGLDAALAMHAGSGNTVGGSCLANCGYIFRYHGKPAHSAAAPHEGINALDAAIGTFNNVNALRQHIKSDARIHGIITNGGQAANIVPEFAEVRMVVRAAKKDYRDQIAARVRECARSAAAAAGATIEILEDPSYDDQLECPPLSLLMKANMEQVGLTVVDRTGFVTPASTDVGNVSYRVPTEQGGFRITTPDIMVHTAPFCDASASPAADEAIINAAKAIAMTALDVMFDDAAHARVQEGFRKALAK